MTSGPPGRRASNGRPVLEQLAGPLKGLLAVADLAGEGRRAELFEYTPHLGPRREAELGGELVAGQRRARRPPAMPGEGVAEHLPGDLEVRLDHLGARQWRLSAGGEAVGDAEQGHVRRDRLRRGQVD